MYSRRDEPNMSGCGCDIEKGIPFWIVNKITLCDKCGAPMLHKRNGGKYIRNGSNKQKLVCGKEAIEPTLLKNKGGNR